MKRCVAGIVLAMALVACGDENPDHARVQKVARQYYECLLDSDLEDLQATVLWAEGAPADYLAQMQEVYADYLGRERSQHGGLVAATVSRDSLLTDTTAYAFVQIVYGDSTTEEVSHLLVKRGDKWKIK
ncbi:MAG: hypothetical protein HUK02_05455 [Bacteroidaceae bacterium]|nr:hypothetical protein [Bacteroidaceae bacterium]